MRALPALVLLCLAQFMLIIDITVVQVALPTIGTDLALDREALTWVVTTYTLCFGGLMVLGGRLADSFGARRTLMAGLTLFTLASLLCGLAANGVLLVAGRALQGVGAALLSPSALAIITGSFHGPRRNRALGVWAAIGGSGAAVGVLLGGLLTAGPGWAWVFYVNVPIGLLVLLALPAVVPASRGERQRVDVPGALTVTLATALLIYGLVNAGDGGWGTAGTLLPLAGAAICYAAFVLIERRVKAPLMRVETMARRPVLSGTFVMLLATGSMLALFFLSTLYLQHVLRFSALETGLLFLPVAVAITLGAQLGGHLIGRIGGRPVAVGAFALTALGAALMTRISPDAGAYTTLLPGFMVAAFGIGPAFVTATTTTMANVPHGEAGVASGVINTFHELGGSIGVAAVSSVAAASLAPGATGVGGFTTALTLCAVAAVAAALASLGLVPSGRPSGAFVGHGHGH
ncbi:MFS transporter [Nonomuraea sp. NPDC000554]|uniref:MFS transporter n=1 Tax=Nonomuraea sp. NPDC000554 TaxID=3154259 RepID=UPI00331DB153